MTKLIELLILLAIVIIASYFAYESYYSGINFTIQKNQCYAYRKDIIDGESVSYVFKINYADDKNYCRVQGDHDRHYFYGITDCYTREHANYLFDDIEIVPCPDWSY
jgi:uncharacterized protein YxeA